MAGILTGLLGALGGPQNILKSVGGFIGDVLEGAQEGGPFGKVLLRSGSKAVRRLTGLSDQRPIIVPKDMLGKSRQRMEKRQNVMLQQNTAAGLPQTRVIRMPREVTIKKDQRREPALQRDIRILKKQIQDEQDDRRSKPKRRVRRRRGRGRRRRGRRAPRRVRREL